MKFFVHGAGRAGKEAWPAQSQQAAVFADHSQAPTVAAKAAATARQAPCGPVAVVAHSLGAVVAAVAMRDHELSPTHAILVEPALYDLARGHDAIETHIEAMATARDRAASGDLFGYWEIVKPLMFGSPATPEAWPLDIQQAQRFSVIEPPWGHRVEVDLLHSCPTLVLTGGWNTEYEAIADRLKDGETRHVVLEGSGHRVQDHPQFNEIVRDFLA